MKFSDIEKEIRRIVSNEYKVTVEHKNFVIENKSNVLTNMCGDNTMLHSSKECVEKLFNIVENHKVRITRIIAMAIGTLLYIIDPIDLVIDYIPVVGFLDDACIVKTIMQEIVKNKVT